MTTTLNVPEFIRRKRGGTELPPAEIEAFINGYVAGDIPDYQVSAFLMAAFFQGMTPAETAAYTRAMIHSGEVFDLKSIPGVKTDKHSTGGVGDKISLPLAALVAAAGIPVPMMSGRGLGHTGGTLDKLQSIPGFRIDLSQEESRRQLKELNVVMIGQTEKAAPADKKLYALRDVTATVESIPLICGSILSKKVAAGVEALIMDVKAGSGAFMDTVEKADALARQLVSIGTLLGLRMVALITNMDQPLGVEIGNAVEVVESLECLKGGGPRDIRDLVIEEAAEMILLAKRASSLEEARGIARDLLDHGAAMDKFRAMVRAQGGDLSALDDTRKLNISGEIVDIKAPQDGYIGGFATRDIGVACNTLGAGRFKVTDVVDPGVGLSVLVKKGDPVRAGDVLVRIRHRGGRGLAEAKAMLEKSIRIVETPTNPDPLVIRRITPEG